LGGHSMYRFLIVIALAAAFSLPAFAGAKRIPTEMRTLCAEPDPDVQSLEPDLLFTCKHFRVAATTAPTPEPDPEPQPTPGKPQCSDGIDNDGDGRIDFP